MQAEFNYCASVAILRQGDTCSEILMQDRKDGQGLDLPGGHFEEERDKTLEETAKRETLEESGLIVTIHKNLKVFTEVRGDEGQDLLVIHFFAAKVVGGELRKSDETTGFRWVSLETLPAAGVMGKRRKRHPLGFTYAMAKQALTQESPILSKVYDPSNLATVI